MGQPVAFAGQQPDRGDRACVIGGQGWWDRGMVATCCFCWTIARQRRQVWWDRKTEVVGQGDGVMGQGDGSSLLLYWKLDSCFE